MSVNRSALLSIGFMVLVCFGLVSYERTYTPSTIVLESSDKVIFEVEKDILFMFSPVLKEFFAVSPVFKSNEFYFSEIDSTVLNFIISALEKLAPIQKILCENTPQELRFFSFADVKNVLEPMLQTYTKSLAIKERYQSPQQFWGQLLHAVEFLDIKPLVKFLAFKIAEQLQLKEEDLLSQEILVSNGFGYQSEAVMAVLVQQVLLVRNGVEEFTVADFIYKKGQPELVKWIDPKIQQQEVQLKINNEAITGLYGLQCVKNIASVTRLNFENNYLYTLTQQDLSGFDGQKLLSLILDNNSLEFLEYGVFLHAPNLKTLSLNNNNLKIIDDGAFIGLSSLTRLDLARNRLKVITKQMFAGLENLTFLKLDYNELSVIEPGSFDPLVNLHVINLSANYLTELPVDLFANTIRLEDLYLKNNNLRVFLPELLNNLKITNLQIENNYLTPQNITEIDQLSNVMVKSLLPQKNNGEGQP